MKLKITASNKTYYQGIVTTILTNYGGMAGQKLTERVTYLFDKYVIYGFTFVGDYENESECRGVISGLIRPRFTELSSKWKALMNTYGDYNIPTRNEKTLTDRNDRYFNNYQIGKSGTETNSSDGFSVSENSPMGSDELDEITTPSQKLKTEYGDSKTKGETETYSGEIIDDKSISSTEKGIEHYRIAEKMTKIIDTLEDDINMVMYSVFEETTTLY